MAKLASSQPELRKLITGKLLIAWNKITLWWKASTRRMDRMTNPVERTTLFADSRSTVIGAATVAILVGFFLVLAAGFAQPEAVHNAAHDTRHALNFPCH